MDEGIIIRSIFSLLLKLKSFYDASITRRIVDAFSAFFRNLSDGSRIIVYFRKYNMNSPFLINSYVYGLFGKLKAVLIKAAGMVGGFLNRILESSRLISFCNNAFSHIENNLLRSAGIFTGTAAAAYLAASLAGGALDTSRLFISLGILIISVIIALLPFDIREAAKSSIFCRLIRYIYS